MKHTLTYLQLFQIDREFTSLQQNSPGLVLLNAAKLHLFYQQAAQHLEKMNKRLDEIKEKYVEKNDKGEFMVAVTDKGATWKLKHSVTDIATASILTGKQLEDAFQKETTDYLRSLSLSIHF